MHYTIQTLAQLSGVTIRTLRFYDEIGLLKPAYVADNGYRYYDNNQLLLLQQILFFRELGFELKAIQEILQQSDFDKHKTLIAHKQLLHAKIERMHELVATIDTTINHLEGTQLMDSAQLFKGFTHEQQAEHEADLVERYGQDASEHIEQTKRNIKKWTKDDWNNVRKEFEAICNELTHAVQQNIPVTDASVQAVIKRHYNWICQFWTPNRESYAGLGQEYTLPAWSNTFNGYHPQLAQYMADAINMYAQQQL